MNKIFLVSDALVRALGWALVHSLWQATAAALLLLILLPRLQTARQRYWVAYGMLVALFTAALITIGWMYEPREPVEMAGMAVESGVGPFFFVGTEPFDISLWQTFSAWLEANHTWVVALWLLGFGIFLLRLGGGLWQVQRLRTQGVSLPEQQWLERFDALRRSLGFSSVVTLLESALVQTPMAIGWLKPVVLMPIGLVTRLSVAEVEAILAHELAHIARRDWIFNLLQAFIESLFYYHPAVWWISAVVRRERENCCDDAALAATGNPLAFAKALVQVQEMAVPVPVLALGLSGTRRRSLLDRVRRILNQPQQRQHQVMEKITATVILLAFLALVGLRANSTSSMEAVFSQITDIPGALFGSQTKDNQIVSDSLPKPKGTRKITREDDNQRVEAEYHDGQLTRLNIDGKEIPASEFAQHEALVEELMEDVEPPEPPAPPAPPEGFWRTPHPGIWEMPVPPNAPAPAMPGAPIRVYSDKDGEGNTVIRLDNNGDATEVVVKNGEVFINGKKLEKGEAHDIPGFHFGGDGQNYYFQNGEGGSYRFEHAPGMGEHEIALFEADQEAREAELERNSAKREMAKIDRSMAEGRRNYEREMKEARKELKRTQKEWSKGNKDWEKDQKAWAKDQEKWAKEQEKWAKEQEKWQAEQQVWESKHKVMQDVLKKELLKDGLISNPDRFTLELNDKVLNVNQKKQSEELRKKYAELFEKHTGQKLDGKGSFNYNFSDEEH